MFNDPESSPLAAAAAAAAASAPADLRPLRVGLIGLGTVGGGTWRVLRRNQAQLRRRAGRGIEIVAVCARNLERAAALAREGGAEVMADPLALAAREDIDVLVEAAGGTAGPREWVLHAIAHGKHVVTANKALLAEHGAELFAAARQRGVALAYEAAVAASIPIVKTLREGLAANRIERFAGIVNGTTNFILSRMRSEGQDFAAALAEAQALGYAEADPAFDVQGIDAAHKAALLASEAFGAPVRFGELQPEGVAQLQAFDLVCTERLGLRLKLLALAERCGEGEIELRVHPALLPAQHLLAQAEGTTNGLVVHGDASGPTWYFGAGAGAEQTASAVLADLVDVARLQERRAPQPSAATPAPLAVRPLAEVRTRHYFRVPVDDDARLQAAALRVLDDCGVPLRSLSLQHDAGGRTHLVLLTHEARDGDAARALAALAALPGVAAPPVRLRVEPLD